MLRSTLVSALSRCASALVASVAFTLAAASGSCGDDSSGSGASGPNGCGEDPCKLVSPQCGCDDDQHCTVDGQGARFCAKPGSSKVGETCSEGAKDCAGAAICVGVASDLHVCAAFCSTDSDCNDGGLCIRRLSNGMGGNLSGVTLCTDGCDPASLTGCPAPGTACALLRETDGAQRWYGQCLVPPVTSHEGDDCSATPCGPGFACITGDGQMTCQVLCQVGGGACDAPKACTSFQTPVSIGSTEYGVCR